MSSAVSRRHFLKVAGAVSLGFSGLFQMMERTGYAVPALDAIPFGYGPLKADPAGLFDLPEGFTYKVISRRGETMADGLLVPDGADGMAAFPGPAGKTILVRNHELQPDALDKGPFGATNELLGKINPGKLYDFGGGKIPCQGGTTSVLVDTQSLKVEKQVLSLGGTVRNCAGGPTPWNSWLTCEETSLRAEQGLEKDHGYVFEVPASTIDTGAVDPLPIKAMGRFEHEAVAIDPASGIVYLTEDKHEGLIYRFIPTTPGKLLDGGRLQALKVKDQPSLDTRNWPASDKYAPINPAIPVGTTLAVEWVDLEEIDAPKNDLRLRGFEQKGAARFARGEGMWYGEGAVFWACTNGGRIRKGQIWKYVPSAAEGRAEEANQPGQLTLFVEPNDAGLIDNCDNLCVAPWGDLIVCEDGSDDQFLVGVTPKGEIYKMGRNGGGSELAGACFSPDGSTLFMNIQWEGLTLAIQGPWHRRKA